MQKYKLWIILALIVVAFMVLLVWLAPSQSTAQTTTAAKTVQSQAPSTSAQPLTQTQEQTLNSQSQQDTQINCQLQLDASNHLIINEQTRNCFEYFISQYGEKELPQIDRDFKAYLQQNYTAPALAQISDLWQRYVDYRGKMGTLNSSNLSEDDPKYYESIFSNMQNLRKQLFSNYEIEGLFGIEDTYNEYTLKRMAVMADKRLTEVEKAQKLKALFEQLPSDWKENVEQLNKLEDLRKLTAAIKAREGSSAEIQQMRMNLVGPEVTQRLENLDKQRSEWKDKVGNYLSARDSIVKSGMSEDAKQKAVQQLRDQYFEKKQEQLRLSTFESVHDRGGKLPFFE